VAAVLVDDSAVSSRPLLLARTVLSLGLPNLVRVASYRLRLRAGVHPSQRLAPAGPLRGPFFGSVAKTSPLLPPRAWHDAESYFGWMVPADDAVPDWHRSLLTGRSVGGGDQAWWTLPDFDASVGDIKGIWEASRLDWAVNLAQRAKSGEAGSLERLNDWLTNWCEKNPPYRGHNWKCGQEASIRVLHLAIAALVVDQVADARPPLIELVAQHLRRVAPTLGYAVGQDNNHGTSEAAALFVGGSWLETVGHSEGRNWHRIGRMWFSERIQRLVQRDGSFSQYSVNYHRLALDTGSVAELWRRRLRLEPFAEPVYGRLAAATEWLWSMVDPATGDAPNIGANDGANLLRLTDAEYRDYRPSVQLAAALFLDKAAYPQAGPWRRHLDWLDIGTPNTVLDVRSSRVFVDGGYAVLHRGEAAAVLRFPRYRFRPSHADALHVDLWVDGENVLRDGGSFSYAVPDWHAYFTGAPGHNSVQFDDREQMPRVGRFLWGDWSTTRSLEPIRERDGAVSVGASYMDGARASHRRTLALSDSRLLVTDEVAGFDHRAVMRWRLAPGNWTATGKQFARGAQRLSISATVPIVRCELVTGWESLHYGRRTELPVVEVEIASAGTIESQYRWSR
jgi:hypothetical protein